jgi:CRISPR system Cascade subunit CasD
MIAAAQGRTRNTSVADLAKLKFGVRIDQPGKLFDDFQTAKQWYSNKTPQSFISNRHYLHDAVFLVGLEGDDEILSEISLSLQSPRFPIGLGRRACVPELPLVLGTRPTDVMMALIAEPWHAKDWYQRIHDQQRQPHALDLEIVVDTTPDNPDSFVVSDVPVSYSPIYREYSNRFVESRLDGVTIHFDGDIDSTDGSALTVASDLNATNSSIFHAVNAATSNAAGIIGTNTEHDAFVEVDAVEEIFEED